MIPPVVRDTRPITFRIRRRFAAPVETVFRAWTDPDALKHWWCPEGWELAEIEIDLRPGGDYRIGMQRRGDARPVYVCGCFLEVQVPQKLVYTWRWVNAMPEISETRVTVQFREIAGTTEVLLVHENLPGISICLRHRSGWFSAWCRLEEMLSAAQQP